MQKTRYSVFDDGRVVFRYRDPASDESFQVEIRCPIPSRLHQEHHELIEQHRQWALRFNILPGEASYRRYCDTRLDLLAAYQYYDLSFEAAVLHCHLMTWFFVFDDIMDIDHGLEDEVRPYITGLCRRHQDMLDGAIPEENDPQIIPAFFDLLQKVKRFGGHGFTFWLDRMVHHLREYVMGAYWESLIGPTTHENSNTAMYLQVRHMAVGVAPCLDLMAIAAEIPGQPVAGNVFIQRLERLAINYSIWVNDLAGLNRDLKRGLGNVIFTLQKDHSLTLLEAAQMVARMCDAELVAFLQVEKQLPMLLGRDYDNNKKIYDAYADVLKRWMRGLLDWSARSDRYQRQDVNMALQNERSIRKASQKDVPKQGL